MMELEGWLEKNEEMEKCASCNKPVAISVSCLNKSVYNYLNFLYEKGNEIFFNITIGI